VCDSEGLCDEASITIEIGVKDSDEDSIPDAVETLTLDTDGDKDLNYLDLDSDNDGISDEKEAQISDSCNDQPIDTDGDGTPDYLDTDSDNDGFTDEEEGDDDCDGDGIADYIDEYDDCAEYILVPEGFSPNGDGVNDRFVIKGIKDFPNSKLIIFNRWGSKIFEAIGYQNDWDGRADNSMTVGSEIVPEGTYYYVIDLANGEKAIKGFIYINY
jgi:gliding motility-associated-like protein